MLKYFVIPLCQRINQQFFYTSNISCQYDDWDVTLPKLYNFPKKICEGKFLIWSRYIPAFFSNKKSFLGQTLLSLTMGCQLMPSQITVSDLSFIKKYYNTLQHPSKAPTKTVFNEYWLKVSPLHAAQKRSCYRFVSLANGIFFSTYQ